MGEGGCRFPQHPNGMMLTVRREMPTAPVDRGRSSSYVSMTDSSDSMDTADPYKRTLPYPSTTSESFSPSAVLMSMASHTRSSYPSYTPTSSYNYSTSTSSSPAPPTSLSHYQQSQSSHSHPRPSTSSISPYTYAAHPHPSSHPGTPDPFKGLREHNISTKSAWTAIPAVEGFRILDLCKSMSVTRDDARVPCYNRETIFDEEWQAHMKDVHGVFLLWPETWMRRIEVLDLEQFGGDIGACNEVIMDS